MPVAQARIWITALAGPASWVTQRSTVRVLRHLEPDDTVPLWRLWIANNRNARRIAVGDAVFVHTPTGKLRGTLESAERAGKERLLRIRLCTG